MHDGSECTARRGGPRIANVSAQQLLLPHSLRLRHVDLDPPRQRMQNTPCSKAASCLQVIWGQASGLAVFMLGNSNIPNRREQECSGADAAFYIRATSSQQARFPVSARRRNIRRQTPPETLHGPQQDPKGWGRGGRPRLTRPIRTRRVSFKVHILWHSKLFQVVSASEQTRRDGEKSEGIMGRKQ